MRAVHSMPVAKPVYSIAFATLFRGWSEKVPTKKVSATLCGGWRHALGAAIGELSGKTVQPGPPWPAGTDARPLPAGGAEGC